MESKQLDSKTHLKASLLGLPLEVRQLTWTFRMSEYIRRARDLELAEIIA